MIANDAERVGGGQIEDRRLGIGGAVHRPRQRRFQEPEIANSWPAAMLGELFVMDGQDYVLCQPPPFAHRASSRSALRCFFISLRASPICRSNSGSYGVMRKPSGVSVR